MQFENRFKIINTSSTIREFLGGNDLDRALMPGERQIGRLIVPDFQRQIAWTEEQKIKLVESLFLGLPIGAIVVNRTDSFSDTDCLYDSLLLDGQQRMSAIYQYIQNEFAVDNVYYDDMPIATKRGFMMQTISVCMSSLIDIDLCKDLYHRLAYGGTVHAPEQYKNFYGN